MKLFLQSRPAVLRAQSAAIRKLARWLIAEWPALNALKSWDEITLTLTGDDGILPINRATFGKNEPTDVICLTYRDMSGGTDHATGEIFVNVQRARELGHHARATSLELALYIAHGLHHLAGASDRTPSLRRSMLNEENAWLSKAKKKGFLKNLG